MRPLIAAILLATTLVANACAEKPSVVPQEAAAVSRGDVTKTLRSPSPVRKPSLPVSVSTTLPERIAAGETLTLDVRIHSVLQQGDITVTFVPDEGLALVSPQQELSYTLGPGGLNTRVPVTVLPAKDGRYAITVDIRISDDGVTQGTARGITFRVGEAPATAQALTRSGADREPAVISLPALETITRTPR